MKRHGFGFTLVELLAVIAIVAILAAILLPAIASANHKAESVPCQSNLRGLHQAMTLFASDHDGQLPYWKSESLNVGWIQMLWRDGYLGPTNVVTALENELAWCRSARRAARPLQFPKFSYGMTLLGDSTKARVEGTYIFMPWTLGTIPGEFHLMGDACRDTDSPTSGASLGIYEKTDQDVSSAAAFRHAGQRANFVQLSGAVVAMTFQDMMSKGVLDEAKRLP